MMKTLTGPVHVWELFDTRREFSAVTVPYREAAELFQPVRYNALAGKGEQRELIEGHVRKLRREMEAGHYTPTPVGVHLTKRHRERLQVKGGVFALEVHSDDPLHQTDGGHRFEALSRILAELREREGTAKGTPAEAVKRWVGQLLGLPIQATVYLDGDPQQDFVNLQAGRPVDAAHMLSLRIQRRLLDDPALRLAFDIAKVLARHDESPFKGLIRFDSRGLSRLPVTTLCARGASDLGTSLVGLARAGLALAPDCTADHLAGYVLAAHKALAEKAPRLLEHGRVLTTAANDGTKGSATMLLGLAVCLAHRTARLGRHVPDERLLDELVVAAQTSLTDPVSGGFSGPTKRRLLRDFAQLFFDNDGCPKHCGLPTDLVKAVSASAFAVEPLPKEPKPPKVKKGKVAKSEATRNGLRKLPDVDGPSARHAEVGKQTAGTNGSVCPNGAAGVTPPATCSQPESGPVAG